MNSRLNRVELVNCCRVLNSLTIRHRKIKRKKKPKRAIKILRPQLRSFKRDVKITEAVFEELRIFQN